jgi:N-acetyl-anhydromuramyl-L-alanine amidase AmpD
MWTDLKPINLTKIKTYPFPENKYFKEEFTKTQVVLHHTVSGPNVDGDVSTWLNCKDRVATAIIVARDGTPYQLFSSKYWAYHLGSGDHNQDRRSIGIEIDNWGWLTLGTGSLKAYRIEKPKYFIPWSLKITNPNKYYTYYGNTVDVPVQYYPNKFRGYQYYEKYTDEQIQTVGELLLLWKDKYGISLKYNEDMWDLNQKAMKGEPGIWTHDSFRKDKTDCHPQPELIDMLKTLETL